MCLIGTHSNALLGCLLEKEFLRTFLTVRFVYAFLTVSHACRACFCLYKESSFALNTTINIAPLTVILWANNTLSIWIERPRWTRTVESVKKRIVEALVLQTGFSIWWNFESSKALETLPIITGLTITDWTIDTFPYRIIIEAIITFFALREVVCITLHAVISNAFGYTT